MTHQPQSSSNSPQPLAYIHPDAVVHETAEISPFCVIHAGVEIGPSAYIGPHVTLYSGVQIGQGAYISGNVEMNPETDRLDLKKKDVVYANMMHIRIRIGDHVHVESHAHLHGEITIGDNSWIGSSVTIHDGARIGKSVKIFPGAVISAIPQDLKFEGEKTLLEIGDGTTIRECATLNRGTSAHGKTQVGKNCLIMAYAHVAHDCILGDHVILANSVNLAGHVEIGDYAILGGMSGCHQFVRIGAHTMVAGGSKVRKDVPPFIKVGREPVQYAGVNSIGLRRRGFEAQVINEIHDIYRHLFLGKMNNAKALDHIVTHLPFSDERDMIVNFVRNSERGIVKGY